MGMFTPNQGTGKFNWDCRPAFSRVMLFVFTVVLSLGWRAGFSQTNYVSWSFTTSITSANYSTNLTNQNNARTTALTGATLTSIGLNGVTGTGANTNHRTTAWPAGALDAAKYLEFSVTLAATEYFPNSTMNLAISAAVSSLTTAARSYSVYYGWGASPTFAIVNATANNASGTATTGGTVNLLTTAATTNNAVIPAPGNGTTQKLTIRILAFNAAGAATGNYQIATMALTGAAPAAGASITGAATATAFTSTYGTASAPQSFTVSGSGLSANLVATAPTGFEVSSDGTTYGSTATFTQSSGSASGNLRIRLSATATPGADYNAKNIVLSSTGATSVNITTAASGNDMAKATPTVTVTGASSYTFNGSPQGPAGYTAPAVGSGVAPTGAVTFSYEGTGATSYGPSATAPTDQGDYKVTATIAADANYNSASSSAYLFSINSLLSQTITFDPVTSPVTYGDASFALSASSTSSLTVTFESSNPSVLSVSGSTVTILAPGTATLTAKQAGDATYAPATDVTQSVTVNAKQLTVNGVFVTAKTYDGNDVATVSGGTLNGVVGLDDVSLVQAGFYNNKLAGIGKPVTTTFTLSGAKASFYTVAQQVISGDINQKELTLNGAVAANKNYDGTNEATITGTLTGVVSGDAVGYSGTGTFASNGPGNGIAVTSTATLTGADASNYFLTQPTGLSANIISNAFTAGNLVVYRVGSGTGSLVSTGNPVFLDEYTTTGTLVRSVAMPTTVSGSSYPVYSQGTSTSEGMMTLSADGRYLIVPGYGGTAASGSLNATDPNTVRRVIGRVSAEGIINTTTAINDLNSGVTYRGAASSNGTDLWITGGTAGVRYTTLGQTTSTAITATTFNGRTINVFNNQLYINNATTLNTVGTGLPTTATQTITSFLTAPGSSTYNFFLADLSPSVSGPDVLYFVDDATNLLYKYSLVGGTWTANGSVAATAARGLTGSVSGSTVTLFATTGSAAAAGGGSIYTKVDNSGYNTTITTGAVTTIATASANTAFRGVAFAPVNPVPPVITSALTAGHTYGSANTYTVTASNQPTSLSATNLPAGASFSSPAINFTATVAPGTYNISLGASNVGGSDAQTLVYTVSKATPVVTVSGSLNYTYTGLPLGPSSASAPAVGTGDAPTGTITFSYTGTGATTYGPSATAPTDPGTYEVVATIAEDANYLSAASAAYAFNITNLLAQSITFDALSPVTYGDASFSLSATASSSLTVSYSSSNTAVAQISGSTVTLVGAGSAVITASQAGDATYSAATDVTQTLTVNPKQLSVINAVVTPKTYDRTTAATITGAELSGVINSDDVTLAGGAVFNDRTAGTDKPMVTSFTLNGTKASNYTLVQPSLTGTINKLSLTVNSAAASNKLYDGTTNANLTGTLSGVISPDAVTLVGTNAGTFASAGPGAGIAVTANYTLSGADAGNYQVTQPTGLTATIFALLNVGDITILGYNTTNPDNLTFVTWVDLQNGAYLKFTDCGFNSAAASTAAGNARASENFVIWQNNTGSSIPAGTVIKIEGLTASTGVCTAGSASGLTGVTTTDQLFAYQSADNTGTAPGMSNSTTAATFTGKMLFGVNIGSNWLTTGTAAAGTSYLPSDLNVTNGNLVFATSAVYGQYSGSRTNQSTFEAYKALVNNSANWSTAGTGSTTLNTTAFTLASTYTITATAGTGGTITPSGTVSVNQNGSQSFTISPNSCYEISDVLVDGISQGAISDFSFTDVTANHTIEVSFTPSTSTIWLGSVNSDWNNSSNWTCGVPNSSTNAIIPGGGAPALSADGSVLSVSLQPGAILNLNGHQLTATASVLGTGTISGSATSSLSIGFTSTLNFTSGAQVLKNLTINTGTTTLATPLSITAGASSNNFGTVTVANGAALASNGNLTLKSNAFGTARVAAGSTSGNYITGDVTVERYIPANTKRAWRLLSVPTKGSQTFKQAWQENQSAGANGNPGYGTIITGSIPGGTAAAVAAGFDFWNSGGSLQSYNSSTQRWANVTSTLTSMQTNQGYFLYIRGDRSVAPASSVVSTATTLRTTGTLYQGDNDGGTYAIAPSKFEIVGNTFASAIDWTLLNKSGGLSQTFYLWDPKAGSASTPGAYQTFSFVNGYVPLLPGSYSLVNPTTTIESGQAFMVTAAGTSGSISIPESAKVAGVGQNVFRPSGTASTNPATAPMQMTANLISLSTPAGVTVDGNITVLDPAFSNDVDGMDALKMNNPGENFAVNRNGVNLAIEVRQPVVTKDTIFFRMWNMRQQNYKLELLPINMVKPGLTAVLKDKHLNTTTPVNLGVLPVNYNFTVDTSGGSSAIDRFMIILTQAATGPLPVDLLSVNASKASEGVQVNWKVAAEQNIVRYDVERSTDGRNFTAVAHQPATASNAALSHQYNFLDVARMQGDVFYRIRVIGLGGEEKLSPAVRVKLGAVKPAFVIAPNPVTGGAVNIQFMNQPAGTYQVRVLSATGQVLFSKNLNHAGGNATQRVTLPSKMAAGNYQLELMNASRVASSQTLLIQ